MRDPDRDPDVIRARAVLRWSKATDADIIEASGVLKRNGDWIDSIEAGFQDHALRQRELAAIDAALSRDWRPWALMALAASVAIAFAFF